jgi:hypothetical protein
MANDQVALQRLKVAAVNGRGAKRTKTGIHPVNHPTLLDAAFHGGAVGGHGGAVFGTQHELGTALGYGIPVAQRPRLDKI